MTTARFTARKLDEREVASLVGKVVAELSALSGLKAMVLFGSAAEGTMTEASDLDVALIFDTPESAKRAQKTAHALRREATWPMDILCIDVENFLRKSAIGGVYFVVKEEGRVIFGEMPHEKAKEAN